jgi:hypothetical protein
MYPISIQSYKTVGRLFVVAMVLTHVFFLWNVRHEVARGDPDFTVYYTAGWMLREGQGSQLYNPHAQIAVQQEFATRSDTPDNLLPYIHPPFEALIFLPLTFLPYTAAFAVWNLLNLGMLLGASHLLRGSVECLRLISQVDLYLALLAFFPVFANFHQGQDAILLLLIVLLAFRAWDRGEDFTAGLWVGAGLFKYHLILPLAAVLLLWRGRKFLLGLLTTASAAVLISLALVGWQEALVYPGFTWHVLSQPLLGRIPFRQLPNLVGLIAGWSSKEYAGWLLPAVVLVCSILLLAVAVRMGRGAIDRSIARMAFAFALTSALFVGYSTNTYDLCLLVLPIALVIDHVVREPADPAWQRLALIVPILPLLLSSLWFYLWMRWVHINVVAGCISWWLYAMGKEILRMRARAARLVSTLV